MIFPENIPVYGDKSFRGKCPREQIEQMSFFNQIRSVYPDTFGAIAIHPRNEGLLEKGQFSSVLKHKAEGMTKGASDVVIPGNPSFICEIKRQNHTLSSWQDGQVEYMKSCQKAGAFVCVALGAIAAWKAFEEWKEVYYDRQS